MSRIYVASSWRNQTQPSVVDALREDVDVREGGCDYCGAPDVRDNPEPFGGKPCCDACFNLIIGGDVNDPPWRCGNAR